MDDRPLPTESILPRISKNGSSAHFGDFVIGETCALLYPLSSGSSGSPRSESKGPITSATYLADPAIDSPDIPEQDGLGQPAELSGISVITKIRARKRHPCIFSAQPSNGSKALLLQIRHERFGRHRYFHHILRRYLFLSRMYDPVFLVVSSISCFVVGIALFLQLIGSPDMHNRLCFNHSLLSSLRT